MQSERNKGAASARDLILCKIIGFQNDLGNDESNPKYQALQDLMNEIIKDCGDFMQPYKA